jgi:hypothetical protein
MNIVFLNLAGAENLEGNVTSVANRHRHRLAMALARHSMSLCIIGDLRCVNPKQKEPEVVNSEL